MLRDRAADLTRLRELTPHAWPNTSTPTTGKDCRIWNGPGGCGSRSPRAGQQTVADRLALPRPVRHHHGHGRPPGRLRRSDAARGRRLARVSLQCRPALDIIACYGHYRDVLLYVDPPYPGGTRSGGGTYVHDMPGDTNHRQLANRRTPTECSCW